MPTLLPKEGIITALFGNEGQRIYYSLDQANTNTASTIAPSTTITPPTTTATTGNIGTSTSSTTASSDTGTASVINAYDLAVAILYEYFVPATNIVAERYRFRQRSQRHDETIDQFVTALRQLVVHCEFGDLQQEMLRDQIVEKCLNNRLRERLLLEPKLTLNKTLEISRQIEGAMRESKAISEGASGYTAGSANLQNVHGKQSKRRNKKHSSHEAAQSNKQNTDAQKRLTTTCKVLDDVFEGTNSSSGNILYDGKAGFKVGECSHIRCRHTYWNAITRHRSNQVSDLQITGGQVKIQRVEDSTLAGDHDQGLTSQLTDEFPILFSSSLGRAHNFVHRVKTRQDVTPVAQKLRRLPFSVRDKVTAELKRLENEGIIERIDASEWVSPIVVVGKKSGKIRLCIDLREANKAVIVDKYPLPNITELFNNLQGAKIFSKLDLASAYHQVKIVGILQHL
ncbi:hypothetical protein BSL78_29263 [Apostichopus japonicus]|uniref:Reverse transcriptase domain-containing protein n=1 Tax=Stichopus japonicus TaxID=307972 RepID=A0A2G8JDT5_STIJA|nr:hypothetical protein BSL78_29263 [Apostichopus japonicus]